MQLSIEGNTIKFVTVIHTKQMDVTLCTYFAFFPKLVYPTPPELILGFSLRPNESGSAWVRL
jgi:hypothetical protein